MVGCGLTLDQPIWATPCKADERLARLGTRWVVSAGVPDQAHPAWQIRYNSARLLGMTDAATLAERAFRDSGNNFGVGVLALPTCASAHRVSQCKEIASRMQDSVDANDLRAPETATAFLNAANVKDH